jgi:hypothetical protein
MTDDTINEPYPTVEQFPAAPRVTGPMVIPPSSPLLSPNKSVRQAWQSALAIIRKKNIAARNNGGKRVPLA